MPRKGGDSGRRPRSEATATKAVAYFVLTTFRIDIYGVFRNGNLTGRPPISTSGLLRFATGHSTCSFVAVTPQASTLIREGKPPPALRAAWRRQASGISWVPFPFFVVLKSTFLLEIHYCFAVLFFLALFLFRQSFAHSTLTLKLLVTHFKVTRSLFSSCTVYTWVWERSLLGW